MRIRVLVIDGQGGKLGQCLIEAVRESCPEAEITAVGTNGIATASMGKAKPNYMATGENAVVVCCRNSQVILGPLGILVADSMLGEITPAMAVAVGQSSAEKILLPVGNRCGVTIAGVAERTMTAYVQDAVRRVNVL